MQRFHHRGVLPETNIMTLRKLILLAIQVFAGSYLSGQDQTPAPRPKTHFCELGFNLYRLDYASSYLYQGYYSYNSFEHNFFRGMNFKYYFGKNAIRSSADYRKEGSYPDATLPFSEARLSKAGSLTLGYQRLFFKGRFSPYVFTDLGYMHLEKRGSYQYDCYVSIPPDFNRNYHLITSFFSVSTGLGLRYTPLKPLVLSLEGNIQYYMLREKDLNNKTSPYRTRGLLFNPLQFSLGFIF